jgi:hypothetical protein
MSSRLGLDSQGRRVAVVTIRTLPDLEMGHVFVVVGDTVAAAGTRIFFLADETRCASRPATVQERAEAQRHAPYRPNLSRQAREHQRVHDDELADQAAIELARKEQQREPVDLIGRAA